MVESVHKREPRQLDLPLVSGGGWRAAAVIAENVWFKKVILACIIANALSLGLDAHLGEAHPLHRHIEGLDRYFLAIFTAEIVLKLAAWGPRGFARDPWNLFDSVVVSLSYIAMAPFISALRTLRVLRVLRLVSAVPQMRRVVEALFGAMPGILATLAVLAVVFYIGAVMSTTLFAGYCAAPAQGSGFTAYGEDNPACGFSDLGVSTLTLFKLTLFDDWGATVDGMTLHAPWAWAFILGFTVLSAFAVLNLFIGVIVDAVQETRLVGAEQMQRDVQEIERDVEEIEEGVEGIATDVHALSRAQDTAQGALMSELRQIRAELAALRSKIGA